MKRAKKPPPKDVIDDATVFADILMVGRDDELDATYRARIDEIVLLAMGEYLRRYPKMRKMNNDPWVEMPLRDGQRFQQSDHGIITHSGETDYQCMFCRKSINTLARYKIANKEFRKMLRDDHIDECAMRFLAGLMKPHAPLAYGEPGL